MLSRIEAAARTEVIVKPTTAGEELQIGDYWTYVSRDRITSRIKATVTHAVTDVTPSEIGIRVTMPRKPPAFLLCDRSWNMIDDGVWRYMPHNGMGIKAPIIVGNTWPIKATYFHNEKDACWRRSGTTNVLARRTVTTKAGAFDTFEIVSVFCDEKSNDPTRKIQAVQRMWYAPAISRWVKRTHEIRMQERNILRKSMDELIGYSCRGQIANRKRS